mmetsp:Transcript_2073/g.5031  ORF Transcript_2073/g.5031 Transcript_2073/m.5031 type:complete len:217 (-) Transcript_2073:614-1264(-)
MWRSPASLLNVLPQWGHFVSPESAPPAATKVCWISSAFAAACSSPASAFAAKIAALNARDFFFHSGTAVCLPVLVPTVALHCGLPTECCSRSILLALAIKSFAFSKSPSRDAALLNGFLFCWKTFLHIFMCLLTLSLLKRRPQSGQGTRLPSSPFLGEAPAKEELPGSATGVPAAAAMPPRYQPDPADCPGAERSGNASTGDLLAAVTGEIPVMRG